MTNEASEDYLGFRIEARFGQEPGRFLCVVFVRPPDGGHIGFLEAVDSVLHDVPTAGLPKGRDEFSQWLLARGKSRARAAIAVDELASLDQQTYFYDPETLPQSRQDSEIQRVILNAFRRIRRLDPQHFGHVPLDGAGVCLLRNIRKDEFDYNLQRLQDRGWVEAWGMGWDEHNYNATITELGLQSLELMEQSASGAASSPSRAENSEDSMEYFVAHEFTPNQVDDLRGAIAVALSGSGLTSYYADNELRQGHIFRDKILEKIRVSRFGIYEISNPNKPNVFLELGAGLALGKPCIIICRQGTQVPADLQGLDRIEYQSYLDLTNQLREKLRPYF
jgi:hypothetical protein